MKRVLPWAPYLLYSTAALAAIAMVFHALPFTRQPDVQHMEYAFRLLQALYEGNPASYLLEPQKYPLLGVLPLSALYGLVLIVLWLTGKIPSLSQGDIEQYIFSGPSEIHLVTRLSVLASGIVLAFLVYRISKKTFPNSSPFFAVVLLLSSMLFLTFATSMRQHVPEVCLTFLTFYFSYQLAEKKSLRAELLAFGSATAAFCMLQNGIFAFIFPVWAFSSSHGRLDLKRVLRPRLWLYLVTSFFLASLLGYPFLWKEVLLEGHLGFGLGNEDIGESPWGVRGFYVLLRTYLGSETLLSIFAVAALIRWYKGKIALPQFWFCFILYFLFYILFFGFIGWTTPRYFFPFVPFLAVLGGEALSAFRFVKIPIVLLVALLHLQIAILGFKPDTYDIARTFLLSETQGAIASTVPHYYLGIPPTRSSIRNPTMRREQYMLLLDHDLPNARPFVPMSEAENARVIVTTAATVNIPAGNWKDCARISSSKSDEPIFLWSETETAFFWIWRTRNQGPNITIYCRESGLKST